VTNQHEQPPEKVACQRFVNRRALVTGGASGIGRATAERLATEGAHVVIADTNEELANETSSAINAAGGSATASVLDQSLEDSIDRLASSLQLDGGLDVVCINAGVHPGGQDFGLLRNEVWDRTHAVNVRGAFLVARRVVPLLQMRGGGAIVLTGSVAGLRPAARDAAYATSKAALHARGRSLALELAPLQIRVNSILPGIAITPLSLSQSAAAGVSIHSAADVVPLGRVASAAEVAASIAFLASADASYITGVELIVDGGVAAAGPGYSARRGD
jgi:NAD(P)-dependent dehydrogenase (short-subunit alcohol dehydrogenase family)